MGVGAKGRYLCVGEGEILILIGSSRTGPVHFTTFLKKNGNVFRKLLSRNPEKSLKNDGFLVVFRDRD